jgi:hypothetical protein
MEAAYDVLLLHAVLLNSFCSLLSVLFYYQLLLLIIDYCSYHYGVNSHFWMIILLRREARSSLAILGSPLALPA